MIGKLENQLRNANQRQAKESGFCPLSFVLSCFVDCKRSALPPRHNPLRQQKSRKIMRLSHHRHKRKSTLLKRGLVTERSLEGFPFLSFHFHYNTGFWFVKYSRVKPRKIGRWGKISPSIFPFQRHFRVYQAMHLLQFSGSFPSAGLH